MIVISPTSANRLNQLSAEILDIIGDPVEVFGDGQTKLLTGLTKSKKAIMVISSDQIQGVTSTLDYLKRKGRIPENRTIVEF